MKWSHLVALLCFLFGLALSSAAGAQEEDESGAGKPSSNYIDLSPAFVTNYGGVGKLRYLKATISLRVSGGDEGTEAVRHHMPHIRHVLVMLLSKQTEEALSSMEGKEQLRQTALESVREVIDSEEGGNSVDDLLFTSFIIQR